MENVITVDRIFRITKEIDNYLLTRCHKEKIEGRNTNKSKILREIVFEHMSK